MDNQKIKFDFVFLGQSILKYQVPLDIFTAINQIYEQNYYRLEPANKQLVGKIENEHSLFYHGEDQSKMKNHNLLPRNVTDYFMSMFNPSLHCIDVDNTTWPDYNYWAVDSWTSFSNNCNPSAIKTVSTHKKLIKVVDIQGRAIRAVPNIPLIYIYSDGTVEKKIFIE